MVLHWMSSRRVRCSAVCIDGGHQTLPRPVVGVAFACMLLLASAAKIEHVVVLVMENRYVCVRPLAGARRITDAGIP